MSASPVARQVTQSQAIPRRVTITSASQLPNEYSTTPGGTIYSTTPGGTRIVYERAFLMQLRNSPLARTPPKNMHVIPGLTPSNTSPSVSPSKLIHDNGAVLNKPGTSGKGAASASASPPTTASVPVPATTSSSQQQQQQQDDSQFQMEL